MANKTLAKKTVDTFVNAETLSDLKNAYVAATLKYRAKNLLTEIDVLYLNGFDKVKDLERNKKGEVYTRTRPLVEDEKFFVKALHLLKKVADVEITMDGAWLWVADAEGHEGACKEQREALKEAGCWYSAKRQQWYIAPQK